MHKDVGYMKSGNHKLTQIQSEPQNSCCIRLVNVSKVQLVIMISSTLYSDSTQCKSSINFYETCTVVQNLKSKNVKKSNSIL